MYQVYIRGTHLLDSLGILLFDMYQYYEGGKRNNLLRHTAREY